MRIATSRDTGALLTIVRDIQSGENRRLRVCAMALITVLLALVSVIGLSDAATASAVHDPAPVAETGVGTHTLAGSLVVEASNTVSAGQRRDNRPVTAVEAVGLRVAPNTTGDCELVPVWFGQKRISPTYREGSIEGPPSGVIKVFTDARAPGVYIAESNRTLAAYSLAGAPTAPACLLSPVPQDVLLRLNEGPLPPQTSLPSPVVSVTVSQRNLTPVAPYQVTSTVSVPRTLPPC